MWCDGAMASRSDPACDAQPTGSPHDGAFAAARPDGASTAHDPAADAVAALARVVAGVAGGVRRREQERLAAAVASAVDAGETLVVEAPTGVGKSLGYLVPTVLADRGDADGAQRPVVVATATKALQQQLVETDLPRLAALDHQLTWATVKGRANYLCRARLDAIDRGEEQALFTERVDPAAWDRLRAWAEQTTDGDRAHAPAGVNDALWAQVSVSANECPGARRCPFGDVCHAEHAKARAAAADVVVTNQHVLLLDAAVEGALLPPPAVRATAGEEPAGRVAEAAEELAGALAQLPAGERVTPAQGPLAAALATAESAVSGLRQMLRGLADDADGLGRGGQPAEDCGREGGGPDAQPAASFDGETTQRAIVDGAARTLLAELAELREHDPDEAVAWVEAGDAGGAVLRLAPIEVAGLLGGALDTGPPVVLTSATLSVGGDLSPTIARWGLPPDAVATEQIASPFDHARQGRLFVPKHLPDPRRPEWEDGARELTWRLLAAAGGRSLALFTSWRRLHDTADWLAQHHAPWTLLRQGETAPHQLIARFRDEEASVLLATMSFWEGVDAPGDACLQVIIDKLPFPRRDDPLLAARRERAEASERSAFSEVDLPLAAVRLAQGAGRLIRSADDAGVVAVLDPRLATAGYRSVLLDSMPPLTRTVRVADVEAFLATHLAGA
ncbi:MAG: ATP-dependent helicase [Actinobacteria bacterium QS_8_72_14]|nr:MAG: ATP-dependent helicase [Actinobacteria bacterium QS_8_72_14]